MSGSNTKRRYVLFARDPHCYWCGKLTALDLGRPKLKHDTSTVDHLYSRLHPERRHPHRSHAARRGKTVLACHQCNAARSHAECTGRTFVPKLGSKRLMAEMTSVSPLGAAPLPPRIEVIPATHSEPWPVCDHHAMLIGQIQNAPDWPTTQRLMRERFEWSKTHRCRKPETVNHRSVSKRVGLATIGELIGVGSKIHEKMVVIVKA